MGWAAAGAAWLANAVGAGSAAAAAPTVAGATATASGAAFPTGAGASLLGSAKAVPAAASVAKSGSIFTAANAFKAASVIAPIASAALQPKPGAPGRPKTLNTDAAAAEAADRERLKRAQGTRGNILTGPAGAPGSALVGRTILSGG